MAALGGGKEKVQAALQESIKTVIFLLDNWDFLSRDRVRKFGPPILKVIKGSTINKTNQSSNSDLSVEKLQNEVDIARKRGSAPPRRYYHLINGKRICQAILSEMKNLVSIITGSIKYIEVQQLRNTKEASDRSPTWSKPANTNFWVIDKP